MVTLFISCEGYTEEVFIKRLMAKELAHLGVTLIPVIVMTSNSKSGVVRRGLWSLDDSADFKNKEKFLWTSMIRQPEFVTAEVFAEAYRTVEEKRTLIRQRRGSKHFPKVFACSACI